MADGISIDFDLRGMSQIEENIKDFNKKIDKSISPASRAGALVIVRFAKEYVRRDTGKLSRSIRQRIEVRRTHQVIQRIGTDVIYAPPQEFGTIKMSGKPFLRPAAFNHGEDIKAAVFKVINTTIETYVPTPTNPNKK